MVPSSRLSYGSLHGHRMLTVIQFTEITRHLRRYLLGLVASHGSALIQYFKKVARLSFHHVFLWMWTISSSLESLPVIATIRSSSISSDCVKHFHYFGKNRS